MISTKAGCDATPICDRIEGLRHEPWVGETFPQAPIKFYLLGDWHYDETLFECHVTHEVVTKHAMKGGLRFMTGCDQLTTGLNKPLSDLPEFWQSVAFSNLSTTQAREPRELASIDGYQQGARCFREIVLFVRPDVIIGFGDNVWNSLSSENVLVEETQTDDIWHGKVADVPYMHCRHPSAAFSYEDWSGRLSRFLVMSKIDRNRAIEFVDAARAIPQSELLKAYS